MQSHRFFLAALPALAILAANANAAPTNDYPCAAMVSSKAKTAFNSDAGNRSAGITASQVKIRQFTEYNSGTMHYVVSVTGSDGTQKSIPVNLDEENDAVSRCSQDYYEHEQGGANARQNSATKISEKSTPPQKSDGDSLNDDAAAAGDTSVGGMESPQSP
jgi:hypothetical protein